MGWQDRRYDDFDEGRTPGWKRAFRRIFVESDNFFSWALPLFTLWGIRVRVHIFFVVWMAVEIVSSIRRDSEGWIFVLARLGTLFGLVLVHEFGHCIACRRVGGEADEIVMWPLGGLAMCLPPKSWRANLITTLGGPATHIPMGLLLGAGLLALGAPASSLAFNPLRIGQSYLTHAEFFQGSLWTLKLIVWRAYVTNLMLLAFNMLLVMFPMDAGRVLQELMWRRMGYGRSMLYATTIGIITAVCVGLFALGFDMPKSSSNSLFAIAVFCGITCFHERRKLAMVAEEPWAESIAENRAETDRQYKAALRKQQAARADAAAEQAEENRILEKIAQSGLTSLNRKEQAFLKAQTEKRRGVGAG